MKLSNRISGMQASPIRRLTPYADKARKTGKNVIPLNIGQPDIKTPASFFKALDSFNESVLAYGSSEGNHDLISVIRDYYKGYDMNYDEDEIIITAGGSEALMFAIMAVCDPGDNFLVAEPFYTNYNSFAQINGVTVKGITTKAEDGYHFPPKAEIESKIDSKTRAFLLNNPCNPTGTVYTPDEVKMIIDIAVKHNLYIVADEVYREFIYGGEKYRSFGSYPEGKDNVVIVDSVSKRYSACGARIGCLASKNKDFNAAVMKLCQARLCVPTLEQIGAVELYKTPVSYFKEVNDEYKKRRDVTLAGLKKIPGVVCEEPKGAFYVAAKLPVDDAEKFIIWMLENFDDNKDTLMMTPLEGFYATKGLGKNEVRIAYVLEAPKLERAMEVLGKALEKYPGKTK